MGALTEKQILSFEAKGFNRWTNGNMDRLYINCTSYGCEFYYYKTGNISDAYFQGERVSNAEGRRFKATKVYVDVKTGELHIDTSTRYESEIREAVEAIIASVIEEDGERAIEKRERLIASMRSYISGKHGELDGKADVDEAKRAKTHANFDALLEKSIAYINGLDYRTLIQLDADPQKIALTAYYSLFYDSLI